VNQDEPADPICASWNCLLSEIRKRPAMFLGSISLQALQHFVGGFTMAEWMYTIPEQRRREVEDFPWNDFESYVAEFHNERRLTLNSFGLAQYEAQGKDLKAFDCSIEYAGAWEIWWRWHDEYKVTI
jgi:hypothetical protein